MANHWAQHGRDITLVTLTSKDADFYTLDSRVQRVALGLTGSSCNFLVAAWKNFQRVYQLRQAIKNSQPDIVVSLVDKTNVLALMSGCGLRAPLLASEQIDPRQYEIGFVWERLRRLLYPLAGAVVMQTEGVRAWAECLVEKERVYVIPSPVHVPTNNIESLTPKSLRGSERVVAAMGRLNRQKGFDLLLQAFAKCASKHPNWSLLILGEGEERASLEALASELGIKDRVAMPGCVQDPSRILRQTDLFVLSSRFEGFPNALLEAMACNLPVVTTDCPSGPRDIVRNDVDGILVPPNDADALVGPMDRLMGDETERQRLSANAGMVIERFGLEKIMNMWDELLHDTCRRTHK
jgi:glycosyltransferase involved in cell wall biosynthesis